MASQISHAALRLASVVPTQYIIKSIPNNQFDTWDCLLGIYVTLTLKNVLQKFLEISNQSIIKHRFRFSFANWKFSDDGNTKSCKYSEKKCWFAICVILINYIVLVTALYLNINVSTRIGCSLYGLRYLKECFLWGQAKSIKRNSCLGYLYMCLRTSLKVMVAK